MPTASPTRPATIHQRSDPSRLTAAVVNGPIDLGTLGGKFSYADGINAVGQVVGTSDTGADVTPGFYVAHAFLWQSGTGMIDLGTLGGTHSWASAINDRGQVVGRSYLAGNAQQRAFLWQSGTGMIDLGTLGGSDSDALGINVRGQVIGVSTTAGNAQRHAFVWESATGMIDLGTLGGNTEAVERHCPQHAFRSNARVQAGDVAAEAVTHQPSRFVG